jgi:hypothetical protein
LLKIDPNEQVSVKRRDDARAQYIYATWIGNERALESVWKLFPPEESEINSYYANLAKERLAEVFLEGDLPEKALPIYSELAKLQEPQFHIHGIAGQAICHDRLGDTQLAAEKLAEYVSTQPADPRQAIELPGRMDNDIRELMLKYRPGGDAEAADSSS